MHSVSYQAAKAGLASRLRLFGVDINYTRSGDSPQVVPVRGIISGASEERSLQEGGFQAEVSAVCRLPRDIGFRPAIGDLVTVSAGASYRVHGVGDVPQSPEWRLALAQLFD